MVPSEIEVPKNIFKRSKMKPKRQNVSSHGIYYAPLSDRIVKRVVSRLSQRSGNSKRSLGKDLVAAVTQATDWFFEQLGADLGAFAHHGNRKNIDESDVTAILTR